MSDSAQHGLAHRSSTVTSTAGPVGASYAVVEKNWTCQACKAENLAKQKQCFRCRKNKPEQQKGAKKHTGQRGGRKDSGWREALDPVSKQIYYYNELTGEKTWERPEQMGETPLATGWFGRGKAGQKAVYEQKNVEYLKRPAPKQTDTLANHNVAYQEGSTEFNIWFGRYEGENWKEKVREPAGTRCNVEMHAGYTQADKKAPESSYFCLFWGRGQCAKGKNCSFFHRIPTITDCGRLARDMMHDAFGRERHAQHRDDMSGVGSFNDSSRTLYVGGLLRGPYENDPKALKKVVEAHFAEWGEVENVNVIWRLAIAFVRYRMRSNAEVAKEAMMNQALEHNEILNIRWAHDDPNPVAQAAMKRADADAVIAAVKASGHSLKNEEYQTPAGYSAPALPSSASSSSSSSKSSSSSQNDDSAIGSYPDTDVQYPQFPQQQQQPPYPTGPPQMMAPQAMYPTQYPYPYHPAYPAYPAPQFQQYQQQPPPPPAGVPPVPPPGPPQQLQYPPHQQYPPSHPRIPTQNAQQNGHATTEKKVQEQEVPDGAAEGKNIAAAKTSLSPQEAASASNSSDNNSNSNSNSNGNSSSTSKFKRSTDDSDVPEHPSTDSSNSKKAKTN